MINTAHVASKNTISSSFLSISLSPFQLLSFCDEFIITICKKGMKGYPGKIIKCLKVRTKNINNGEIQ